MITHKTTFRPAFHFMPLPPDDRRIRSVCIDPRQDRYSLKVDDTVIVSGLDINQIASALKYLRALESRIVELAKSAEQSKFAIPLAVNALLDTNLTPIRPLSRIGNDGRIYFFHNFFVSAETYRPDRYVVSLTRRAADEKGNHTIHICGGLDARQAAALRHYLHAVETRFTYLIALEESGAYLELSREFESALRNLLQGK